MLVLNTNPPQLNKRLVSDSKSFETHRIISELGVTTVCQSAGCPNLNECYAKGHVTFLILGDFCTRACAFCSVRKGLPQKPDRSESDRIKTAVERLNLDYAVITSVTRDDLEDGGADQFAKTIKAIRGIGKAIKIEVLVPDFQGDAGPLGKVLEAGPDIFSHNTETVESLYPSVRQKAAYGRSLDILRGVKRVSRSQITKSGIMVGLGESEEEVLETIEDIRSTGCDILTIGQYLRPAGVNLPVKRYVEPEEFERYRVLANKLGFKHAACGPFVRSSYMAKESYLVVSGKS